MRKVYVLTGGSGYLGSLMVVEILKKGDKVVLFGRGKNGLSFRERIDDIISKIYPAYPKENIQTIETDLQKDNLGLEDKEIFKLKNRVSGFWHLAANLSFKSKYKEDVLETNVNGLKKMLSVVEKIDSPFYFVSTAYVCGRKTGIFYEDDRGKPKIFNNAYEESKYIAEKVLRKWSQDNGREYIIFRPSILISRSLKQLSYFGFYNVVNALHKWSKKIDKFKIKPFFLFPYYQKAILNLMPVETAIDWMLEIAADEKAINKTYHITNPNPFPIKDVARQTFKILKIKLIIFSLPKIFISWYLNFFYYISYFFKPGKKVAKNFFYYKHYIMQDTIFDLKNTKKILGESKVAQTKFSMDFIENITDEFIRTISK